MSSVKIFNKLSDKGKERLNKNNLHLTEETDPEIILLRSQKLHDYNFESNPKLKAIGRAGAGTNNIPVEKCTELGIAVFNTPGANANAVKELVLSSLFIASRNIFKGLIYVNSLKHSDVNIHEEVEANKSKFKGFEISGKKLGIVGLGAIGVLVANDAVKLGLDVYGFDPYISVNRAWGLSSSVNQVQNLNKMLSEVDFVSCHMPLNNSTRNFLDTSKINSLKKGCTVLNFSRPEIVDEKAILQGLESNKVGKYVTDFPTNSLLENENVIGLPHLGASTNEAEDNCAVIIVNQVNDYIKNGNVTNSVNLPNCQLERTSQFRLTILNDNKPNMVGQISAELSKESLNICEMMNKSKGDLAYTIIDLDECPSQIIIDSIKSLEGVRFVRLFS